MSAHVDILEQRDSLKRPVAFSVAAHVLFFGAVAAYTIIGVHNRVTWGDPHALGGGSVGVNAVSQIPLPARSGAENLLANDTESRVPMAPKPQKKAVQAPQPDAIPLRGRQAHERQKPLTKYQQYRPLGDRTNQLYTNSGQALSSNMFGAMTGTGGVGVGPGSAFGERFGAYRDLLEQRIAQKWHTEDVDQRLQNPPTVIVTFDILRNGSIRGVKILQTSNNRTLDYSAQRAIYEASPFPPLPMGYDRDSAEVEIWFQLKR